MTRLLPGPDPGDPWPTVLLEHTLPDGRRHVDWMLAVEAGGSASLVSFRLPRRPDLIEADHVCGAQRIEDHHPRWLDREGALSGGRGRCHRLAKGWIGRWDRTPDRWRLRIDWEGIDAPMDLVLEHDGDDRWSVSRALESPVPCLVDRHGSAGDAR